MKTAAELKVKLPSTRPHVPQLPQEILPHILEWWSASDTSTLIGSTGGTGSVGSDGDPVGKWTGKIAGTVVTALDDSHRPTWKTNSVGSQPAIRFTDSQTGMRGAFSATLAAGTIIVIGHANSYNHYAYRGAASLGSTTSGGGGSYDSVLLGWFDATTVMVISDNSGTFDNAAFATQTIADQNPWMLVATFDGTVASGVLSKPGVAKLYLNGGYPANDLYANITAKPFTYVAIGGRTDDWFSPGMDISEVILCSAEETTKTLELLRTNYLSWKYGTAL